MTGFLEPCQAFGQVRNVGQDGNTGIDPFGALDALQYVTFLAIGYMVARGLAKSGSRENHTN